MIPCYLCLGSNQKNPERQIRIALRALKQLPSSALLKVSNLYWNPAWGHVVQQDFCNVVVELHTMLKPLKLLSYCQAIEKKQGRIRKKKWGPRTLDIDIILYGDRKINTPKLCVPHPRMLERNFVLIPLLEVNPQLGSVEPRFIRSIHEFLRQAVGLRGRDEYQQTLAKQFTLV